MKNILELRLYPIRLIVAFCGVRERRWLARCADDCAFANRDHCANGDHCADGNPDQLCREVEDARSYKYVRRTSLLCSG